MKRSEFIEAYMYEEGPGRRVIWSKDPAERAAETVEKAGFTWEPEEPEVLWEGADLSGRPIQFLADHGWRVEAKTGGWSELNPNLEYLSVFNELGRRLLEERKQQEALDEHNDKLEAEMERVSRESPAWSRLSFLERQESEQVETNKELRGRLDSVEADCRNHLSILGGVLDRLQAIEETVHADIDPRLTKLEQDFLLVRGQAAHVDEREAADIEATRIHLDGLGERVEALEGHLEAWRSGIQACLDMLHTRISQLEGRPLQAMEHSDMPLGEQPRVNLDYSEWKRLVALDELWGPEGELRRQLEEERLPGVAGTATRNWFNQLRSELLALPDEVKQ